jgi:hypothetical protein
LAMAMALQPAADTETSTDELNFFQQLPTI